MTTWQMMAQSSHSIPTTRPLCTGQAKKVLFIDNAATLWEDLLVLLVFSFICFCCSPVIAHRCTAIDPRSGLGC